MTAAKRAGFRWFLLPFMMLAVKAQNCPTPDSVFHPEILTSNINGMAANLTVECHKDEVKLTLSSGGILVRNVKVFQECVLHNGSEMGSHADSDTTLILYDGSTGDGPHQEHWTNSSPNQVLLDDVVCSYHGCYETKRYEYSLNYYLTFTAESMCTFAHRIEVSSPVMSPQLTIYRESSMNAASLLHHTRSRYMISSTMAGMLLSSSVSQLQPTPFPGVREEITSIDSPSTPPLPTPTSISPSPTMAVGFPSYTEDLISVVTNTPTTSNVLQWTITTIAFLIPLVLAMLFVIIGICFIKGKAGIITRQWWQYSEKNERTAFYPDEPIDVSFVPVDVDLPALSKSYSSLQSVQTRIDPLDYCSPAHCGTSVEDASQTTTLPVTARHMRSLLDIAHFEGESEKLSVESDSQSLHTPRQCHDPSVCENSIKSLDQQSSAYNYSSGSREYVQLDRWYNGTSGSKNTTPATTATFINSDGETVSTSAMVSRSKISHIQNVMVTKIDIP